MADDELISLVPTHDVNHRLDNKTHYHDGGGVDQRMVNKLEREELEDKYLRLYEDNIKLKKHARKQEDKIKRMATKLLRLVNDKKKAETDNSVMGKKGSGRNLELEEKLEELQGQVRELEKHNAQLKEKLIVTKQQLATTTKRPSAYNHVPSRINTGVHKTVTDPRLVKNMRVQMPVESSHRSLHAARSASPSAPGRYGHSVLEETRTENKHLQDYIGQLEDQVGIYEMEIDKLRDENRVKEDEFEEDILKIKQQMTAEHRTTVQENIELIRLQREVKDKASKMAGLQEKFTALDQTLHTVRGAHEGVLSEMERLSSQLKDEQKRALKLQNQLTSESTNRKELLQVQELLSDVQKENIILKESNDKLVSSAFDLEREREWRQREQALKIQIAQLESTMKSDLGEKASILDKLTNQRGNTEDLEKDHRELNLRYLQLKEEYDDIKRKMSFFTKESAVDMSELEEALVLIKQRQHTAKPLPEFLQQDITENSKDLHYRFRELEAEHAETVQELEKTRNLLIVQHRINSHYQKEMETSTVRLEETKHEYDQRMDEYARLLDLRAARIKKLESQMRDVAYGTKQYKVSTPADEDLTSELDEIVHLERGQNLLEIRIHKVLLSDEGLKCLSDETPALFCTWEFFEFELQSTPVIRSARPEFEFISQYSVRVDDFFLHYLHKEKCKLEVHQSFGQEFQTAAAGHLNLSGLLDSQNARLHGHLTLTGVRDDSVGVNFGTVEYTVRLRVPMEHALRLYKERTKALGYISTNEQQSQQALQALDEAAMQRPADNVNQLHVKILCGLGLHARRENMQPSPYCIYQLYDFSDHDTDIVQNSNNPEFNNHHTFPLPMTVQLDNYLRKVPLKIFLFDDADPEQAVYLGMASIPLLPLVHDQPITGSFQLTQADGSTNGVLELDMRWQYTYAAPSITLQPSSHATEAAPQETPEKLVDESVIPQKPVVSPRSPHPKPRIAARFPNQTPMATSTPLPKEKQHVDEESVQQNDAYVNNNANVDENVAPVQGSLVLDKLYTKQPDQEKAPSPRARKHVTLDDHSPSVSIIPRTSLSEDDQSIMEPDLVSQTVTEVVSGIMSPGSTLKDGSIAEEIEEQLEDTLSSNGTFTESKEEENAANEPSVKSNGRVMPEMESDSEGVVVEQEYRMHQKNLLSLTLGTSVTVVISHMWMVEGSSVLLSNAIERLFVEYRFLGVPSNETETPFSLPKPTAHNENIIFNFSKTFAVDMEHNYDRRQYLASMLLPSDPDHGRIRFTVVSDPPEEEQDTECEDVGVAFVSLQDILRNNKDIVDMDVPIYDIQEERELLGFMNLSVQCLNTLQVIKSETLVDTLHS